MKTFEIELTDKQCDLLAKYGEAIDFPIDDDEDAEILIKTLFARELDRLTANI